MTHAIRDGLLALSRMMTEKASPIALRSITAFAAGGLAFALHLFNQRNASGQTEQLALMAAMTVILSVVSGAISLNSHRLVRAFIDAHYVFIAGFVSVVALILTSLLPEKQIFAGVTAVLILTPLLTRSAKSIAEVVQLALVVTGVVLALATNDFIFLVPAAIGVLVPSAIYGSAGVANPLKPSPIVTVLAYVLFNLVVVLMIFTLWIYFRERISVQSLGVALTDPPPRNYGIDVIGRYPGMLLMSVVIATVSVIAQRWRKFKMAGMIGFGLAIGLDYLDFIIWQTAVTMGFFSLILLIADSPSDSESQNNYSLPSLICGVFALIHLASTAPPADGFIAMVILALLDTLVLVPFFLGSLGSELLEYRRSKKKNV